MPDKIAVGIATTGRPNVLNELLRELTIQSRVPDCVFICPAAASDFEWNVEEELNYPIIRVNGNRGLPAQRNAILDAALDFDIIVFLDDDFFPASSFLNRTESCFSSNHDIVAISGYLIADGIKGPGLEVGEARLMLAEFDVRNHKLEIFDQYNAYGCNMCLRLSAINSAYLRFDEDLPLYGWFEDVDFCRRLVRYGRIVRDTSLLGVHLGAKVGRTSGVRFGYSQIANPLYIWTKGSASLRWALLNISKNVATNILRIFFPEPWVDRRGRLRGNFLAVRDLISGRLHPNKILNI